MPDTPLVTIYMPTRGRPSLVSRAISSVLAQHYRNFELRVVVDGPDEQTETVLRRYEDSRLIVTVLEAPGGACRARNVAIAAARGELITGLDDDDELLPHHISRLIASFTSSSVAFVCTSAIHRRPESRFVRHAFEGPIEIERLLHENVVGNQVFTRTECLRELNGFDEGMPAWQDYDLWVRLCSTFGSGLRIDARTYIQHLEHLGPRISSPERIRQGYERFISKHSNLLEERHLASLELLMFATTHQTFPITKLPRYFAAGLGRRAATAFMADRMPYLRDLLRKLRRP